MKKTIFFAILSCILSSQMSCQNAAAPEKTKALVSNKEEVKDDLWEPVDTSGKTIQTRFRPPAGFERITSTENSFAAYLQNLPLKASGTKVKYYDGRTKTNRQIYLAVVDIDVGKRDLQQCADAIMRLRAEHLWAQESYDDIHFNFTNGFRVDYSKYRQGYRMKVAGNKTTWYPGAEPSTSYRTFRRYMDLIFTYAGTLSLSKELNPVAVKDMQIGDVFIQGGSPGHAVIVVDMAKNPDTGQKLFMLAQSYMPAQDIQVLHNPNDPKQSPWYFLDFGDTLYTPEWTFGAGDLKRFLD